MMIILNRFKEKTFLSCLFLIGWPVYMLSFTGEAYGQSKIEKAKPNIVFLISEDNSKHFMKLFDSNGVETPNIEKMLQSGLLYPNAFSNAPVCSVARSTLISGTLTTRTGMYLHRKIKIAPMPEGLEMFPAYLRKAGYYTTNNYKKDYNAVEKENVWDNSSKKAAWQNRPDKNQPFFIKKPFTKAMKAGYIFQMM